METFKIKSTAWVLFIITILIVIIGGIILCTKIFPLKNNAGLAIPLVIVVFIAAYFASGLTSVAIIEVTITEQNIHFNWTKNYLFQSNSEMTVAWSDILEYKFQRDRNFDLLKFKFVGDRTFRIWHNNGLIKDDFYKLVPAFEERVQSYNENQIAETNIIKRSKTIYETWLGVILAIAASIFLISIPIVIYFLPHKSKINWFGSGAAYAGALFFIGQVIHYRKKKASANKGIAASGAGR